MRSAFVLLFVCVAGPGWAQPKEQAWRVALDAYWAEVDSTYRDTLHSPLPKLDRKDFEALERFPVDPAYRVLARFETLEGPVFGMKTSTEREPKYRSVGTLHFMLAGVEEQLTVYKNIDLSRLDEYRNYLFVPFTDLTNAEATYGGGRYIDLEGPLGEEVELDFNRAYNPYCAYGGAYSCPIPPLENHLELPVRAGVLKYHDH
ncbi:MAG: DUF1684 domain-containing protein [Flavobacteriales bacterium]|jgi:uncharacterized protein (DUF1684 family)|nr:DUF1684 domain-containing protein [Flavobacteriales bacterium]MBK6552223.1 DUF1684 domain-containing protein [Flavobacteriales bacterium]MBK6881394.1 DUF1684 domain-containing protein [Flavobacteriales bacterium]MBK7102709.1 DUF1684 domain-containing protein [Flavobacteriales bacterium]MBK7113684.1 DUF1684 domain-containing protein [Flavobacteriales bacterium]